eukprot:scaffold869_cov105-Isochrysis_galbana.AAC.38
MVAMDSRSPNVCARGAGGLRDVAATTCSLVKEAVTHLDHVPSAMGCDAGEHRMRVVQVRRSADVVLKEQHARSVAG